MAPVEQNSGSRSLAMYRLVLKLYAPEFLERHRAEMLQNFEDLESASSSKAALWLLLPGDLLVSLKQEHMKSLNTLPAYVIGVVIAWAAIFTVGYFRYGPTPGHPALHVFGGFLFGMLSIYIATRVYPSNPLNTLPAYVIGVLIASVAIFTVGYLRYGSTPGHPALPVFGGFLLGMLSMYIATRVYP